MEGFNSLILFLTTVAPLATPPDGITFQSPNEKENLELDPCYSPYFVPGPFLCAFNEHYERRGRYCQPKCENEPCPNDCIMEGCFCDDGYVRGPTGVCIKLEECPLFGFSASYTECLEREEFSICNAHCQDNCSNIEYVERPCPRMCVPGCVCKKPYVRGMDGKCILPEQCLTAKNLQPLQCSEYEEYTECNANCDKNCSNYNQNLPCLSACKEGCTCKVPFIRGPNGDCILPSQCPVIHESSVPQCPPNERYSFCGANCQETCEERQIPCFPFCEAGCVCEVPLVKNAEGKCVQRENCFEETAWTDDETAEEKKPSHFGHFPFNPCEKDEEFLLCPSLCPDDCDNFQDKNRTCTSVCYHVPGCQCKKGYVRGPAGHCITPDQCPIKKIDGDFPRCSSFEEYKECGTACPRNCTNYNKNIPCTKQCVSGCFCNEPRVKDLFGRCILPEDCPKLEETAYADDESAEEKKQYHSGHFPFNPCEENEVFLLCPSLCPDDCDNFHDKDRTCTSVCYPVPGCQCKKGYVRGPAGHCITPDQCPRKRFMEIFRDVFAVNQQ